jgi:apolipoprotein N-acyltransferase
LAQLALLVLLGLAGWLQSVSLAWSLGVELPALGLVQGQSQWWLQVVAMAVFAASLLAAKSVKQAAWRSWVFSLAWLCGSIWWLYISMHVYGGLPSWLAALAVLVLGSCLALFYMLVCMLFKHLAEVLYSFLAILFGACWMLAEMARGTWLTGFPWGAVGYAHVDGPLAALAPYIGVYGMSFVAAWIAMLVAQVIASWIKSNKTHSDNSHGLQNIAVRIQCAVVVLLFATISFISNNVTDKPSNIASQTPPLKVTLLQGNIPQNEKFQPGTGMATALSWYAEQLQNAPDGLVVTPETAIPTIPQQLPPDYWSKLQQPFKLANGKKAALIGIPMGSRDTGFSNSVLGIKPTQIAMGAPYRYDKHHVVPFGEFIPPFAQWFLDLMKIPLGSFNRGSLDQAPFVWQGERLGLNICYEDLFGEELAHRFADAALAPTMLVNVTNIAWFGNTIAIDQHLNIARMRSKELARPSIRATNTGATVIINAQGQVTQAIQRHTRGVLTGEVQGNTEITPFAWWVSRFWLWPMWFIGVACLIFWKCYSYTASKR